MSQLPGNYAWVLKLPGMVYVLVIGALIGITLGSSGFNSLVRRR